MYIPSTPSTFVGARKNEIKWEDINSEINVIYVPPPPPPPTDQDCHDFDFFFHACRDF